MCGWRRSLRLAADVSRVLHEAARREPARRWVMLTLTVRNVQGGQLPESVDALLHGWRHLLKRRALAAVAGSFRTLEVTRNDATGEWHPHLHALLWVESWYFGGRGYVRQAQWRELWRDALGVDYLPVVEVHAVRSRRAGNALNALNDAALEVGKYTVKDSDLVPPRASDKEVMERVAVLDRALAGRRLVDWSGDLRRIARELRAEAPEDGDLIHVDEYGLCDDRQTCPVCGSVMVEHVYRWISTVGEYVG